MNAGRVCVAVVGAAVVLLPSVLLAQMDPNSNGPQAPGMGDVQREPGTTSTTNPNATNQPNGSMRDSLGAPGQTGQAILDKQFVRMAAEDGLVDVKLGTLAAQKGGSDVKDVAQKMVDDHTAMNKDMATVADSMGVMLPKKISKDGEAEYDKLNGLSGKDFDAEYLVFILKAHRESLHSFYMESSVAVNPDLQAEVVKALGMMREHLGLIAKAAAAEDITLPKRPPRPAAATASKN